MKIGDIVRMDAYGGDEITPIWLVMVRIVPSFAIDRPYHTGRVLNDGSLRLADGSSFTFGERVMVSSTEDELIVISEDLVPDWVWVNLAKMRLSEKNQ